jgi:hypothetical protein
MAFVSTLAVTLWLFATDGIGQVASGPAVRDQSHSAAEARIVEISIRDGKLLGGPLRSVENDVLVLKIKSDEEEQLHIEGYHAFTKLSPGRTVTLEVWTATVGNFPILLDKSKRHVGNLEVVSKPQ